MREQAEKLRQTLMHDGGGAETAFKMMIKSELIAVFAQYMTVDDISLQIEDNAVNIKVSGSDIKRVGYYREK